jgi:hypothetical protein
MRASPSDNLSVKKRVVKKKGVKKRQSSVAAEMCEPFLPGALVIVTLCNPREKFWGMIIALRSEGFSLSGAELASIEDITLMVRNGEPFTPAIAFFPMHRIERVELDAPVGSLPSLSQRFLARTGLQPSVALAPVRLSEPSRLRAPKERA